MDLPIHVWTADNTVVVTKITRSPYYISLSENDPTAFLAYQETMQGLPTAYSEITWEQFLDLRDDIAENGLRDESEPITFRNGGQVDGHHRLAILCHLHGPEAEVLLSNGAATFPAPAMNLTDPQAPSPSLMRHVGPYCSP